MIISQTPLRVSLFGGGTDFKEYFHQHGGAVLTMGIDKFIYVIIKDRFDADIYVNYSRKEIVKRVEDLEHGLVREAMRMADIRAGIEITTLADIPSEGSGLGSSSSVTVGLLNAMHAHQGSPVTLETLAIQACKVEIDILGKPIGVQDQVIAAHGNLCFVEFKVGGEIVVERLNLPHSAKQRLAGNLMLFFTNRTRSADRILKEQRANIDDRIAELGRLRDYAFQGREALLTGDMDAIGSMLDEAWAVKKALASGVTDPEIDRMYSAAREAGAMGGKVAGAGGGGFLLLYARPEHQSNIRLALSEYRELPFGISRDGSKIIFNIND